MDPDLIEVLKLDLECHDEPATTLNTLIQMDKAMVHDVQLNSAEPKSPPRNIGDYTPSKALFSVNANDVFAWCCADSEFIESEEEIWKLAEFVVADPKYGDFRWLCWKRQSKPQPPWIDRLKKEGVWDDFFENLPANKMDREIHEMLGINYDQMEERRAAAETETGAKPTL